MEGLDELVMEELVVELVLELVEGLLEVVREDDFVGVIVFVDEMV